MNPIPFLSQAALSGYSDVPMQIMARRFGAQYTLCEVLLDKFVLDVSKGNKSRFFFGVSGLGHPCGAQLMGSEPDAFVSAAVRLVNVGYDIIDLNFACPVKKVLGRKRGGFLLSDPETALQIVQKVRDAIPHEIPLTIKLRKGFDDSEQSEDNFYRILDGATSLGAAAVTLHGRTVLQRYTGESDWDFVRKVKNHAKIPVIGCGDLFSAETVMKRAEESGVDGVALARGIIGNPWLFSEVRALSEKRPKPSSPTLCEQRAVIEEHIQLAAEFYGARSSAAAFRAHAIRYSQRHPNYEIVRSEFARAKSYKDMLNVLVANY